MGKCQSETIVVQISGARGKFRFQKAVNSYTFTEYSVIVLQFIHKAIFKYIHDFLSQILLSSDYSMEVTT